MQDKIRQDNQTENTGMKTGRVNRYAIQPVAKEAEHVKNEVTSHDPRDEAQIRYGLI